MDYLRYNSALTVAQHHNLIDRRLAPYNPSYTALEIIPKSKPSNIPILTMREQAKVSGFPPLDPLRIKKSDLIAYAPKFIERVFGCDSFPPESFSTKIQLSAFITNIMNRTRLKTCTLTTAFLYLNRLKQHHPRCKGSAGSGYRLFLAAIILAAKYMYDDTFDNTAWATVSSGLFPLEEVNHMEREMLSFLDFQLFIKDSEWVNFSENLLLDMTSSYKEQPQQSYLTPMSSSDELHHASANQDSNIWPENQSNSHTNTTKYMGNSWITAEGYQRP
jgi:Cyclin, N-terminal domain